ncbi:MAG: 4Fe-4S binding protein [Erysipelotrichaceae bacterium]|nr:4Fe-4S binding protein [Erysipelotrichaceae bacterium]
MDQYQVNRDECIYCGACIDGCPVGAIQDDGSAAEINVDDCIGCGNCADNCPVGAITRR